MESYPSSVEQNYADPSDDQVWVYDEYSLGTIPTSGNTNDSYTPVHDIPIVHEPQRESYASSAMLEEGWEKEIIDFGLVALEALAACIYPRFPVSERTRDTAIDRAEAEALHVKALQVIDAYTFDAYTNEDHQTDFPLAA